MEGHYAKWAAWDVESELSAIDAAACEEDDAVVVSAAKRREAGILKTLVRTAGVTSSWARVALLRSTLVRPQVRLAADAGAEDRQRWGHVADVLHELMSNGISPLVDAVSGAVKAAADARKHWSHTAHRKSAQQVALVASAQMYAAAVDRWKTAAAAAAACQQALVAAKACEGRPPEVKEMVGTIIGQGSWCDEASAVADQARQDALWGEGRSRYRCKDLTGSVNALREVLRANPKHVQAWVLRGRGFLALGGLLLAELHLKQANQVDSGSAMVKSWLASVAKCIDAEKSLDEQTVVNREWARLTADATESKDIRDDPLILWLDRATAASTAGLTIFNEAYFFTAGVKYQVALRCIEYGAALLQARGHIDSDARDIARQLDLAAARAHINLASCFLQRQHDYARAAHHATLALELVPGSPKALVRRARAWVNLGRFQDAVSDLRLAQARTTGKTHSLIGKELSHAQFLAAQAMEEVSTALTVPERNLVFILNTWHHASGVQHDSDQFAWLAQHGTTFAAHQTATAGAAPALVSWLCGQLPTGHGCSQSAGIAKRPGDPGTQPSQQCADNSWVHTLRQAGLQTICFGPWFVPSVPPSAFGFEQHVPTVTHHETLQAMEQWVQTHAAHQPRFALIVLLGHPQEPWDWNPAYQPRTQWPPSSSTAAAVKTASQELFVPSNGLHDLCATRTIAISESVERLKQDYSLIIAVSSLMGVPHNCLPFYNGSHQVMHVPFVIGCGDWKSHGGRTVYSATSALSVGSLLLQLTGVQAAESPVAQFILQDGHPDVPPPQPAYFLSTDDPLRGSLMFGGKSRLPGVGRTLFKLGILGLPFPALEHVPCQIEAAIIPVRLPGATSVTTFKLLQRFSTASDYARWQPAVPELIRQSCGVQYECELYNVTDDATESHNLLLSPDTLPSPTVLGAVLAAVYEQRRALVGVSGEDVDQPFVRACRVPASALAYTQPYAFSSAETATMFIGIATSLLIFVGLLCVVLSMRF